MKRSSARTSTANDQVPTELAEDYLRAIAERIDEAGVCRTKYLADRFGVQLPTISKAIARLSQAGFVRRALYKPIELTAAGRRRARKASERYRTVVEFLMHIGVNEEAAMADAEGIEHDASQETLTAMKRILKGRPMDADD